MTFNISSISPKNTVLTAVTVKKVVNITLVYSALLTLIACTSESVIPAISDKNTCDIRNYGAISSDGIADTTAIQSAIDDCSHHSSKHVLIPDGQWLTGLIHLRSNLNIELAKNATLTLIPNIDAFPELFQSNSRNKIRRYRTAIAGTRIRNVHFFGSGLIDGSGEAFWDNNFYNLGIARPTLPRPAPAIDISYATDIKITGIRLKNLPGYAISFRNSENIHVSDITIKNDPRSPNTDGIQIYDSQDIIISGVDIRTGDDAIVLKSRSRLVEHVLVKDSYLESDDGAIKFGTGSYKGVQHSRFENINIANSRYGIAIFAIDGGTHKNNVFKNISITTGGRYKRQYPIFIDIDRRTADRTFGQVDNLLFSNIKITSSGGSLISGNSNAKITNLTFENVTISRTNQLYDLNQSRGKPRGNVHIKPQLQSEDYGKVNADLVLAHVEGLTFKHLTLPTDSSGNRNSMVLIASKHVEGLPNNPHIMTLTLPEGQRLVEQ